MWHQSLGEPVPWRRKHRAEARARKLPQPFLRRAETRERLEQARSQSEAEAAHHVGVAAASEAGLIVPVLKDADQKSLFQIAAELDGLSERAKQGKATREELTGSTFTISSLGTLGGVLATPIINFPEVAILGVHAIKDTPVIRDGQIVVGKKMYLSVSIDHRLVDGATGARWMNVVKEHLEQPWRLFLT